MPESLYRPPANVCPLCNWRAVPDDRSVCLRCVPNPNEAKATADCLDCGHCESCIDRSMAAAAEEPDKLSNLVDAVSVVLLKLDELASVWGDEGVFRSYRDQLRKALAEVVRP